MNLQAMTLVELKALAYDIIVQKEQNENRGQEIMKNLRTVNDRIVIVHQSEMQAKAAAPIEAEAAKAA
jgi:hypothetical protein